MKLKYCPTHLMLADFFTKPLTGKLFHKFRDVIMGYKDIYTLQDEKFSLKERIGNVSENSNIDNLNGRGNKLKQGISWAEIVRSKKTRDKNNERIDSLNNINPINI